MFYLTHFYVCDTLLILGNRTENKANEDSALMDPTLEREDQTVKSKQIIRERQKP